MFKIDSPFMNFFGKVADIIILNIVFMIACIPIITAGAAVTAAYYMGFKIVKNEESYIIKGFLKAFRENLKQGTILWLCVLLLSTFIMLDFHIILYSGLVFPRALLIAMVSLTLIAAVIIVFLFPLQARFENTVKGTIKNAVIMSFSHIPTALFLIMIYALPILLLYFVPQVLPVVLMLGFGGVFYLKSLVLLRIFKKFEATPEEENAADKK